VRDQDQSLTILGRVDGNVTVDERCELKGRAQLMGDLKALARHGGRGHFRWPIGVTPNKGLARQAQGAPEQQPKRNLSRKPNRSRRRTACNGQETPQG